MDEPDGEVTPHLSDGWGAVAAAQAGPDLRHPPFPAGWEGTR